LPGADDKADVGERLGAEAGEGVFDAHGDMLWRVLLD
jgi:hypothetical protein